MQKNIQPARMYAKQKEEQKYNEAQKAVEITDREIDLVESNDSSVTSEMKLKYKVFLEMLRTGNDVDKYQVGEKLSEIEYEAQIMKPEDRANYTHNFSTQSIDDTNRFKARKTLASQRAIDKDKFYSIVLKNIWRKYDKFF